MRKTISSAPARAGALTRAWAMSVIALAFALSIQPATAQAHYTATSMTATSETPAGGVCSFSVMPLESERR